MTDVASPTHNTLYEAVLHKRAQVSAPLVPPPPPLAETIMHPEISILTDGSASDDEEVTFDLSAPIELIEPTFMNAFVNPPPRKLAASTGLSFASLSSDELRLVLSHAADRDLAAVACANRQLAELGRDEQRQRRRAQLRAEAQARREKRLARAQLFAAAETDARLIATVIRFCLLHGANEYTELNGSGPLVPGKVHRLRIGLPDGPGSAEITLGGQNAACSCDVLAMQESALRAVEFCGEPLGAAGAAVAARQAASLGLLVPAREELHGRVFKVFLRSDLIATMMGSSPTLAQLVVPDA